MCGAVIPCDRHSGGRRRHRKRDVVRILLSSYVFYPSVGGIETVSAILAEEFVRRGHELKVVTHTREEGDKLFPYDILRFPGSMKLLQGIRRSDVVLHINISLRTGWPQLVLMKPWVIAHHTWTPNNIAGQIKQSCAFAAQNIAISKAIAAHLRVPSTIIPNPYDDGTFHEDAGLRRDRDLVFVGRLVSDKGVDCALTALHLLKQRRLTPNLTVIGKGPEEAALRRRASDLALADQVVFLGAKQGAELAHEMGRHKVILIPSLWKEPFGIVALEGIASGCVAVGSSAGGLKDAIGPCGVTFPNGNATALADCVAELLLDEARSSAYRRHAKAHLARFTKRAVAERYLEIMEAALNTSHAAASSKATQQTRY
jgi:glycogen synthase